MVSSVDFAKASSQSSGYLILSLKAGGMLCHESESFVEDELVADDEDEQYDELTP